MSIKLLTDKLNVIKALDSFITKPGQVHLTEERAKAWTDWWKKEVLAKIKEIAS